VNSNGVSLFYLDWGFWFSLLCPGKDEVCWGSAFWLHLCIT
jgi:hypothetical protein